MYTLYIATKFVFVSYACVKISWQFRRGLCDTPPWTLCHVCLIWCTCFQPVAFLKGRSYHVTWLTWLLIWWVPVVSVYVYVSRSQIPLPIRVLFECGMAVHETGRAARGGTHSANMHPLRQLEARSQAPGSRARAVSSRGPAGGKTEGRYVRAAAGVSGDCCGTSQIYGGGARREAGSHDRFCVGLRTPSVLGCTACTSVCECIRNKHSVFFISICADQQAIAMGLLDACSLSLATCIWTWYIVLKN